MSRTLYLIIAGLCALTLNAHAAGGMKGFVDKLNDDPTEKFKNAKPEVGVEMSIRVLDATTGQPIPGAEIRAISREGSAKVTTNENGKAMAGLPKPETTYLTIKASHPLYVPTRARWYQKKQSFPIPTAFDLTLEPGHTIGGQIVNDLGQPVEEAKVTLLLAERTRHQEGSPIVDAHLWKQTVTTDNAGRWSYGQAPKNLEALGIKVTHPLYVEKIVNIIPETQEETTLLAQQNVITLDTGASVVGRVLGPDGQPVADAGVKIRATRIGNARAAVTNTDPEGRFFFPAVENGTMTLLADAPGKGPGLIRYELEGEAPLIEVPLEKPQRVFGRVIDPEGKPVPGAMISMELWRGTVDITPVATTDANGYFSWNEAPEDQVLFRISKDGFLSNRLPLAIDADQEVVLSAKRIVRGKVTDAATDEPIRNFRVMLGSSNDGGTTVNWFNTDEMPFGYGFYRINLDVPAANLVIGIQAEGYEDAQSEVIANPGVIEKRHFQLIKE